MYNSFLNSLIEGVSTEDCFQISVANIPIKVTFKFSPYLKQTKFENLPVISHLEFRLDERLKSYFQTTYRSYFFLPILLNDFSNIQEFAEAYLKFWIEEDGINVKTIASDTSQLALF